MAPTWTEAVTRWSAANAQYRTGDAPDRKAEYLLYQTLVGAWPISVERTVEDRHAQGRSRRKGTFVLG